MNSMNNNINIPIHPILIDFGISRNNNEANLYKEYLDPVLLCGILNKPTEESDIWAFGGIFFIKFIFITIY